MADQTPVRNVVHGARVRLVDVSSIGQRQRRDLHVERKLLRGFHDEVPAVLPTMVLVADNLAVCIRGGANLGEVRWTVMVPAEFVAASKLHPDRLSCGLGQDRSRLGRIVVATMPKRP